MATNIEDGIDGEGVVEDLEVETHYAPLEQLIVADGFLRVIGDNGFVNVETRIPFETLERLGWKFVEYA